MITNHIQVNKPIDTDKYYINKSYGGLSLNVPKNNKGYTLPNCVALANAEFSREMNRYSGIVEMCRYFIYDAVNFWWQCTNAKGHYYGIYKVGQKAQEGAIMVWSGGGNNLGHVAIVDYVDGDTLEYVESTASGVIFNRSTCKDVGRRGMSSAYKFLGYIYNPYIYEIKPVKPVKLATQRQIKVISNTLRVRENPSLNARIYGFAEKGIYNIYDTEVNDRYLWLKIGQVEHKSQWIAAVNSAVKDVNAMGQKVIIKNKPNSEIYKVINITMLDDTTDNYTIQSLSSNETIIKRGEELEIYGGGSNGR